MGTRHQNTRLGEVTPLFKKYVISLLFRTVLFCLGVYYFVCDRTQLSIGSVGPSGGLNFVDVAFFFVLLDFLSKFSSRARISIGSLKQYGFFQIPTKNTVRGGFDALLARIQEGIRAGSIRAEKVHSHPKKNIQRRIERIEATLNDARDDIRRELMHIAGDVEVMRALPFDRSDLDVNSQARHILRMRRLKEIVPVALFWVLLSAVVGIFLINMGWMSSEVAVLWMLFFFWFDMVCVVLWCPLQVLFMKNRCCATCQIFNWDAIMVATPLVFAWSIPAAILLVLALVILLRWELRAFFHPERFAEETNASLSCQNCTERLCWFRGKIGFGPKDEELQRALSHEEQ